MADAAETEWEDVEWEDVQPAQPAPAPKPERTLLEHLPGGEQVYNARVMQQMTPEQRKQFIADAYAGKNKDNAAFLLGLIRGGTLEAAPLVSRMASPNEYRDEATAVYDEAERDSPMATMGGRMLGALPAAAVLTRGAPTLAGALQGGLGAGAMATIQGFLGSKVGAGARSSEGEFSGDNVAGKAMDAWSQVPIAVGAQLAGSVAPEIVSRAAALPRKGLDALADWLGGSKAAPAAAPAPAPVASRADDFAAQMSEAAPDDVAPLKPVYDKIQAKPAFDPNTDTGAMKMIDPELDAVGKGDMPPPKSKDPEFLRKSQELADMLAQEQDTVVNASIDPGARGPNIKHKGEYRGQQFRFPNPEKRIGNNGGLDDPAVMAEWQKEPKPTSTLDDLLFGEPSVAEDRAWEQLMAGEMGASRQRNPWNIDSRVGRPMQAPANGAAAAFDGPPTNAKGGADLYQPMGVGEVYPDTQVQPMGDWYERHGANRMTDDLFAEIQSEVNPQGAQNWRASKPAMDPIDVPEFNASRAEAAAQATTPWDDEAIDSARAAGYEKLRGLAGQVGKRVGQGVGGAIGGWAGSLGGLPGQIGGGFLGSEIGKDVGAKLGAKAGAKLFSPEKAAQKLVSDPAMLQRLAAQGGEMGRAAAFVAQGAAEGGETGLKARAYVLAMMPQWRSLFEQQEAR